MSSHEQHSKLYGAIHAQPAAVRTLLADWGETEQAAHKLAGAQRILLTGIGTSFHEEPQVPNFGKPKRGPRLVVGMTIAIEPMVNVGRPEIRTLDDKWTVVTADGSLSAHFEHTVAIERDGPRILTMVPVTAPV